MTDDGRFVSRRERRAQEERETTQVPADTDALALGPISESIPTHAPDGRLLTRRERRRLERARQPMETWTAEEEMIATGQIPAMTPERIAEQERLARERAAQAQREAQLASAELEGIAGHPAVVAAESAPQPPAPPPWERTDEPTPSAPEVAAHSAPAGDHSPAPWAAPDDSPSEPVAPWQSPAPDYPAEHDTSAPEQQSAQDAPPPERTSLIAAVAADAPSPAPATSVSPALGQPESQNPPASTPQPTPAVDVPADTPAPAVTEAAEPAALGMPPGMSPEMFASLFPPGSLQRRLMEDQAAAQQQEQEATPAPEDPAAEIRRLAEEAVAGLDAAGAPASAESAATDVAPLPDSVPASAPTAQEQPPTSSPAEPVTHAPWQPSSELGFDPAGQSQEHALPEWNVPAPASASEREQYGHQSVPSAPDADAEQSAPPTFSIPTLDVPGQSEQPLPPAPEVPSPEPAPAPQLEPFEGAPFDAILGGHPETAAFDQVASRADQSYRFGNVDAGRDAPTEQSPLTDYQPQSAHQSESAESAPELREFSEAPSPWGEHPLSQVEREAPELPEMPPVQAVPQPDLSSVGMRPPLGQSGQVPIVEPVPIGQIEVPPRPRPELTGADVPRSFKWAHLAVFGAVGLLLGVIVWQVA